MQEDAGRADTEDGVPFIERHIDGIFIDDTGGVIDEDVEPAEALDGQRDGVLCRPFRRDCVSRPDGPAPKLKGLEMRTRSGSKVRSRYSPYLAAPSGLIRVGEIPRGKPWAGLCFLGHFGP